MWNVSFSSGHNFAHVTTAELDNSKFIIWLGYWKNWSQF